MLKDIFIDKFKYFILGLIIFYILHLSFVILLDFNFIVKTDVSWYQKTVVNLAEFDSAIQPIFPLLVRICDELYKTYLDDEKSIFAAYLTVQLISVCFYVCVISFLYRRISEQLNDSNIKEKQFLVYSMCFLFVSAFYFIIPRPNVLLYALEILVLYHVLYVNRINYVLWLLLSLLPLLHKSGIIFSFFISIQIILTSFFEKTNRKQIVEILIFLISTIGPLCFYVWMGILCGVHNSFGWWFKSYEHLDFNENTTLNLVVFDGIISRIYFGITNFNIITLIQSSITLLYVSIIIIYGFQLKKLRFFILLYISFLLSVLPYQEINSVMNYSIGIVPLLIINENFRSKFCSNKLILTYALLNLSWLIFVYFSLTK